MNPIMISQVKHFIHSPYFDSFARLHSDLLDRLERATIRRQTGRKISSRHSIGDVPFFHSVFIFFFLFFFLLGESECKGCRNEEGTSVHNSKTSSPSASARIVLSSSRHGRRTPLFLEFSVALVTAGTRRKEILREQVLRAFVLVGYYFYSVSSLVAAWTMSLFEHPFIYESFCIIAIVSFACTWSELVRISTEPSSDVSFRAVQFSRQERAVYIPLYHQHKVSHCHELKDKQKRVELCVLRVDFQFEDSSKYKLITVLVCYNTTSKLRVQLHQNYEYLYIKIK